LQYQTYKLNLKINIYKYIYNLTLLGDEPAFFVPYREHKENILPHLPSIAVDTVPSELDTHIQGLEKEILKLSPVLSPAYEVFAPIS
jgi:hypothetical protein